MVFFFGSLLHWWWWWWWCKNARVQNQKKKLYYACYPKLNEFAFAFSNSSFFLSLSRIRLMFFIQSLYVYQCCHNYHWLLLLLRIIKIERVLFSVWYFVCSRFLVLRSVYLSMLVYVILVNHRSGSLISNIIIIIVYRFVFVPFSLSIYQPEALFCFVFGHWFHKNCRIFFFKEKLKILFVFPSSLSITNTYGTHMTIIIIIIVFLKGTRKNKLNIIKPMKHVFFLVFIFIFGVFSFCFCFLFFLVCVVNVNQNPFFFSRVGNTKKKLCTWPAY